MKSGGREWCVCTCTQISVLGERMGILRVAQYLLEDLRGYLGPLMLKLLVKAVALKNCYSVMVS